MSMYARVLECVYYLCMVQYRMSVEHVAQQVRELKKNLTEMSKNMKKAPKDFRKQMDTFLEVCTALVCWPYGYCRF